jgi:hypothetical protein
MKAIHPGPLLDYIARVQFYKRFIVRLPQVSYNRSIAVEANLTLTSKNLSTISTAHGMLTRCEDDRLINTHQFASSCLMLESAEVVVEEQL